MKIKIKAAPNVCQPLDVALSFEAHALHAQLKNIISIIAFVVNTKKKSGSRRNRFPSFPGQNGEGVFTSLLYTFKTKCQ